MLNSWSLQILQYVKKFSIFGGKYVFQQPYSFYWEGTGGDIFIGSLNQCFLLFGGFIGKVA